MTAPPHLTARALAAYLACNTKGQLLSRSTIVEPSDFTDLVYEEFKTASAALLEQSTGRRLIRYDEIATHIAANDERPCLIDCDTTYVDTNQVGPQQLHKNAKATSELYSPVLFLPHGPIQTWHKTLLCFSAIALHNFAHTIPLVGYICHGYGRNLKKIRLANAIKNTLETLQEAQRTLASKADVPLTLNKYCSVCEYRARCRRIAIDTDNISLIGTIGEKERRKLLERGIATISHLSYGYRPRRKRRAHATARPAATVISAKNDNKLKALAIKKQQVHVIGAQPSKQQGTPVYFDVEGVPGEDFYYLIGMRYNIGDDWIECSLWANTREEERTIWTQCIQRLSSLESPQIIHYGHYETIFFKRMRERYPEAAPSPEYISELLSRSHNLLASIYGSIYFPTYSNGLKDIAGYLGFRWTESESSGALASLCRLHWELTSDDQTKARLLTYNMDDCRAVEVVATAIHLISSGASRNSDSSFDFVDVNSLEVPYQRIFGKFASALPEFQRINDAAYWDYQRERVFVRTDHQFRRIAKSQARPRGGKRVRRPDKSLWVAGSIPTSCVRCKSKIIWKAGCQSQTVADIVFSSKGARRQVTKYAIQRYRCGACRQEMGVPRQKTLFGPNLRAYIIYLLIEMRLSHKNIAGHLKTVFGLVVSSSAINDIKSFVANEYEPLYETLLQTISSGNLVHADETKGVVYGGGHFLWIFTNLTTVAYVYSPTRDADVLQRVLRGFSGVLVSDFYGAYEAIECPQQKCLIHLMRDINEAVLKNPFNSELTSIASRFGALLRDIVDSIDRWGLKARRLRKHKRQADRFLSDIDSFKCSSDAAIALRKRLLKNKSKLFTFLDYDSVPWNNNNAEHAVRAFTRIRNSMATSTVKGTKETAILLSIQQTLKYRNMEFLDFLRSGSKEI
jgi:predicted RecB family nuclease